MARPRWSAWRVVAVTVAGFWLLLTAVYAALIWSDYRETRSEYDLGCEHPEMDSVYLSSRWQWWPPGSYCEWEDGRYHEPSGLSAVALLVVVAGAGGSATVLASTLRRSIRQAR